MSKRASVNAGQALKVAQFFTKRKKGQGDDDTLLTDTMSLISPAGDSNSGLSMFVLTQAEDTEMHLASVRQFAAYIICSMYLAGLDRAYGGVHTEVSRLMTATQDSSRNTVIDFSLVKNMLSTPISSIASFEMGRPHQSVNELELASEISYVLDAGLSKFLFGKDRKKRAAAAAAFGEEPFEVRVGATDPNESAHEFAGKSRVTKTPSVHTYLALTLLDPYAYGISEKRAVLTFLVSVMQRAILRNTKPELFDDRDKKDEIDSEIDSSVVLSSLSASSLVEGDAEEAAAIRAEILKLPTFKKFVRCMREHSADTAHTSNPSFHALYTLLKGTYLVHFSSYYLSMAVNTILRDEMTTENKPSATDAKRKCVLSRSVLSSIEGSARELARLADDVHNDSGTDRLDLHDLRRLISKANVALCELQDRCAYKEEVSGTMKSMTLYGLIPRRMFKEINEAANGAKDVAEALLSKSTEELAEILINGQNRAGAAPDHTTLFPLYTRSSQIFEHDAARDIGDDVTHEDMVQVARFHVALMMYHVNRSTADFHGHNSDEDTSSPEEKMRRVRFFRLRAIVLFLTRLFAFFFRSYTHLVQPRKEQPVIVTMLVGAGWKRSAQRENEAARLQKMFSSFTRVMSNLLLFCHHIKGDLYRGPILMKQLRKLYFSNLALMAVAQQKLLKTVPSCHPFHSGTKTQLTLPTAIAVKMIPTEFVMPPDYTVAGSGDRVYSNTEEENARKAAVGNARVLTGRKGVGELRAMQAADNVVAYINATSAAGPRETAKEFGDGTIGPNKKMKIDPAAYMRALSTKN
jgi:hypothetical protein